MKYQLTSAALLDTSKTIAAALFESAAYPWEVLGQIGDFILSLGGTLDANEYEQLDKDVWVARDAVVYKNATILGPAIIGHKAEVRPGAFIRGKVIIGDGAVVGNSTEIKNSILFAGVQVPHYNYVGDSILGYKAHMGAGSITSNVKSDKSLVTVSFEGKKIETHLKKFGAILGDRVEIGCNSVLNPGSVIGRNSSVYPLSSVRGYIPENHIFKTQGNLVLKDNTSTA